MEKRTLKARDVERLENTSFATALPGQYDVAPPDLPADGTCTCQCGTCTCCLPDIDRSDLCCEVTLVYSLGGRCVVGTERLSEDVQKIIKGEL